MLKRIIPAYDEYDMGGRPRMDATVAIANTNPLLIAMGVIDGISQVNKFGENPTVTVNTTADVWDGGGVYSWPSTADITHLRQATDQVAMRGGTVEVQGLDANYALTVQDVVLDAADTTTPVALTTPLIRAFRMKVQEPVVADQDIELRNVGGGTTYAVIRAGFNQTLMALYTVPAGKTAYMTQYYGDNVPTATRTPDNVDFDLWMRPFGKEFQIKHMRGIPQLGDGFLHGFNPFLRIPEKTDIKISVSVSGSVGEDANPHAGFDLILIDD